MASARGGRRPGSGRKKGSSTVRRMSKEIDKGILPLDMRLRVSRAMWAEAVDEEGEIVDMDKAKAAADFAEPCLPYTSPRLSSIEHSGPGGGPIDARIMTARDELARKLSGKKPG